MHWTKKTILTNGDLMLIFDKGTKTLGRWRKKGLLEDNKIGGTYYYSVEWVLDLIEKFKK